ncbi:methyltransferase domain-containing protein [Micromonospora sp. NPDC007220]|uniref:class I SAM-dependent DNA methyltransferase n=1 Tax=Micromonospora sp. NPDC007220 TaxID=3154318 RepID=UPI0033D2D048
MAEYVDAFVTAYDRFWAPYPERMGEAWLRLHAHVAPGSELSLLDVGCGTGIVAARFAAAGYRVVGVDVSEAMIARARERLAGTDAVLIAADAADFEVPRTCAFAVSTYDVLNHVGDIDRVRSYLRCVHRAVAPGGWFGFDMSTTKGLLADVPPVARQDGTVSVEVARGPLDGDRRPLHVTGELRTDDGRTAPFTTTITNTAHPVADVLSALADAGWTTSHVAAIDDLLTPVPDPEALPRVAVLARRD